MRYLIETYSPHEDGGKFAVRPFVGGAGTYRRKLSCDNTTARNKRVRELNMRGTSWVTMHFNSDSEARRYCKETTEYLNA